jgi:hypothetical protein
MLALALLFHLPVLALHDSPCELMQHPAKYANQTVEVRARVSIGFEDFTLVAPNCAGDPPPVWLAFGGDEPTPIMSMVNDLERKPGSVLKVNGRALTLNRTPTLELFERRLTARRLNSPGETACNGSSNLYSVTATITGVFFSDGKYGGYGHMGFNHLLVIQQVSDVVAERTTVPAGGRFTCSTERWNVPLKEARAWKTKEQNPTLEIARIIGHWHDSPDLAQGTYSPIVNQPAWCSNSLLQSYSFDADKAEASRTKCTVVEPPYPMTRNIGCKNLRSEFSLDKWAISHVGTAETASQFMLKIAAAKWGVKLVNALKLTSCDSIGLEGDQISNCGWVDPNAMQAFSIQIRRLGSQRGNRAWKDVPWTLARWEGAVCEAEN